MKSHKGDRKARIKAAKADRKKQQAQWKDDQEEKERKKKEFRALLRKRIEEKVADEMGDLEKELRELQLMEEKAAKEREAIADSLEEAKLQADENKDEIIEDAKSNKDAIISEIYGADAAAAERAAEFKADFEEKLNENQAENQNNFDALKEHVDEGSKNVLHTILASSKKERQKENDDIKKERQKENDDIVQRIGELFNDTEMGNARRRAADLEIENRKLKAELEAQRGSSTNRELFPEKEEESKPKVPSTPILSAQNRANLPPSAAARSFAASEKHVESTRKENEKKAVFEYLAREYVSNDIGRRLENKA